MFRHYPTINDYYRYNLSITRNNFEHSTFLSVSLFDKDSDTIFLEWELKIDDESNQKRFAQPINYDCADIAMLDIAKFINRFFIETMNSIAIDRHSNIKENVLSLILDCLPLNVDITYTDDLD